MGSAGRRLQGPAVLYLSLVVLPHKISSDDICRAYKFSADRLAFSIFISMY